MPLKLLNTAIRFNLARLKTFHLTSQVQCPAQMQFHNISHLNAIKVKLRCPEYVYFQTEKNNIKIKKHF